MRIWSKRIWSKRIAALRKARGWTQRQVAERIGLTREAVSLLENGKRQPSGSTAILLEQLECESKGS